MFVGYGVRAFVLSGASSLFSAQMRTHPKTLVIDPLIDGANGAQV